MEVRRLTPADVDAFIALRRRSLDDAPLSFAASAEDDRATDREHVLRQLSNQDQAMLGAFDSALIGYVGVVREAPRKRRHRAFVWGTYVFPEHRGKGVGKALMRAAIDVASSWDGVAQLRLSVTTASEAAHRLYERLGFTKWGTEPNALLYDGVAVDEHMLSLDLRMAIRIVAYDPSWPALFEVESKSLKSALQSWLAGPIEHVGSTAVPGLCAKPTVDIMAAVESLEASRDAIQALAAHDYCYSPYRPSQMHWFCKPSPEVRRYHLHLVPFGSSLWNERLAFRDALTREPDLAAEYATLKQKLADEFRFDRDAYTDAKSPFIRRVVEPVLERAPPNSR